MSDPEARHSRNIAARPQVTIVIFDSHEAGRRVEGRLPLGDGGRARRGVGSSCLPGEK
jgi:hypothetical protein